MSGSTADGDAERVAWGWRSKRRVAASVDWRGANASTNDGDSEGDLRFWATAYSFLGTSATADATGARVGASSASAVRTVDRVGDGAQTFATLQAALAGGSGTADDRPLRVELKFDGALATPPISLVGRKVEIVAAAGFRPTLVFNSRDVVDDGWMFLLNSSELTLRGVAIDFTVPTQDVVASKWSVFESTGASALTLLDSSTTVCNAPGEAFSAPLHSNVAIFRTIFETGALDELGGDSKVEERSAASVRLDGFFARGETALFVTNGVGDSLEARRCGLNISGPIFWMNEEERTDAATTADGARSTLIFDRTVVAGRSALAFFNEREGADGVFFPLDASLTNSVIWLNGAPLASAQSSRDLETLSAAGAWNLDGTLLLDVETAARVRARQTSASRDYPTTFVASPKESMKLEDLNPEAVARLSETPPHQFALVDFARWILTPAQNSAALDPATRELAGEIKTNVVDETPSVERRDAAL